MKASGPVHSLLRQSRWLLRIASLLVPANRRSGWFADRYAQVWHWAHFLHESGRLNAVARLDVIRHVWSAFSDAVWQRFDREKVMKWVREGPRSPRFCLAALGVFFITTVIATGFVPTIRASFSSLPYKDPARLASLSFNNSFIRYHSDGLFTAVSDWSAQSKTAEAVAAYSWQPGRIATPSGLLQIITARVSPDFFDVLGVRPGIGRLFHSDDTNQCAGCVVISNHLWQYGFHQDPAIIGKQISYQEGDATIVGVLPDRFRFVSPEISLWTVSGSHAGSFNRAERTGAVLRLRAGRTIRQAEGEFSQFMAQGNPAFGGVDVASIKTLVGQSTEIYFLFAVMALLGSVVLLLYRLGNSGGLKRLGFRENYRWWLFFAAKTVLLLLACLVVSLEGTRRAFQMLNGVIPPFAGPVCIWLFLVIAPLAVTWSVQDQCRRCRLCLKRLGQEIYVGAPARLLLDWWGTELVCSQGHGMLHVPEMRASWLETEHWTPLDDSWKPLFESEDVKV